MIRRTRDLGQGHTDEHDVAADRDRPDIGSEFGPGLRAFRQSTQNVDAIEHPVAETSRGARIVDRNSNDDSLKVA